MSEPELRPGEIVVDMTPRIVTCCVCHLPIDPGPCVQTSRRGWARRHFGCMPKTDTRYHAEKDDAERKISGSPRRRRAGGHGYTGGDGYIDL